MEEGQEMKVQNMEYDGLGPGSVAALVCVYLLVTNGSQLVSNT